MNKRELAMKVRDYCDEFYEKPSPGMSNSIFKDASYKNYAAKALVDFICRYTIDADESIDAFRAVCIISEFEGMMLQGLYESHGLSSKFMFEKGREVCRDMMDIFFDMIPTKERRNNERL